MPRVVIATPLRGLFAILAIAASLVLSALTPVAAAGNASLGLSPNSGVFTVGETVSLRIFEDSGSAGINGVQADLSYDKNALQFVGVDASQSAFPLAMPVSGGNGVVKMARVIPGGSLTGTQTVAVVNFKVLASGGTTAVNFMNSSGIARTSDGASVWNGSQAGATLSFTSNAVPGQAPSPTPSSGGTSSPGSPGSSGGSAPSSPGGGSGSSSGGGSSSSPVPGAPSSGGSVVQAPAEAANQTVELPGSTVAILVLNESGKAVKGATVTLANGQKATTDDKGVAGFSSVPEGEYKVTVAHKGAVKEDTIRVATNSELPQEFKLKLSSAGTERPYWIVWAALAIVIVGTLSIVFPRRPHFASFGVNTTEPADIVVGDFSRHHPPSATPGTQIKPTEFHSSKPPEQANTDDTTKPGQGAPS